MNTNAPRWLLPIVVLSALIAFNAGCVADSRGAGTAGADLGDTAIAGKVKAGYIDDARPKNSNIRVTTVNGVVTRAGTASTPSARSAAAELACTVDGISGIQNDLQPAAASTPSVGCKIQASGMHATQKGERLASDDWVTTRVTSSLLADSIVKGFKINVTTRHHVAFLCDVANTRPSIDHAADLAKRVRG